jgi:V/A-type H+-transporting ATPase subunit K
MNESAKKLKSRIIQSVIMLVTVTAILGTMFCADAFAKASIDKVAGELEISSAKASVMKFALVGAGIAFGLAALGGGYAISHIGAAAMGAIAEKPQIASQALIFVALAEGVVVFGIIVAYLILNKV